jgi:hypothetical protein
MDGYLGYLQTVIYTYEATVNIHSTHLCPGASIYTEKTIRGRLASHFLF